MGVRNDRLRCGKCGIKLPEDAAVTAMDWNQEARSWGSWINDWKFGLICISAFGLCPWVCVDSWVCAVHGGGERCQSDWTPCSDACCYAPVPCASRVWLELPGPGGGGLQLPRAALYLAGGSPWNHGPSACRCAGRHGGWAPPELSPAQGKWRSWRLSSFILWLDAFIWGFTSNNQSSWDAAFFFFLRNEDKVSYQQSIFQYHGFI